MGALGSPGHCPQPGAPGHLRARSFPRKTGGDSTGLSLVPFPGLACHPSRGCCCCFPGPSGSPVGPQPEPSRGRSHLQPLSGIAPGSPITTGDSDSGPGCHLPSPARRKRPRGGSSKLLLGYFPRTCPSREFPSSRPIFQPLSEVSGEAAAPPPPNPGSLGRGALPGPPAPPGGRSSSPGTPKPAVSPRGPQSQPCPPAALCPSRCPRGCRRAPLPSGSLYLHRCSGSVACCHLRCQGTAATRPAPRGTLGTAHATPPRGPALPSCPSLPGFIVPVQTEPSPLPCPGSGTR